MDFKYKTRIAKSAGLLIREARVEYQSNAEFKRA